MMNIIAETGWSRGGICWSVWSPRTSFLDRTSPRLKVYNQAFCDLCDVPNPGNRSLGELIPQTNLLNYLSEEAKADCMASSFAVQRTNDAFYLGVADQATGVITHVSRVGRLHYTLVRQICLRLHGAVHEIISAELLLSPNVRPAAIFFEPYFSLAPTPIARKSNFRWIPVTPKVKPTKRKYVPENFRCSLCGATTTSEARCNAMSVLLLRSNMPCS